MNDICSDARHISFAQIVGCTPETVEEIFLRVGVDETPDHEEAQQLSRSIDLYKRAITKIDVAIRDLKSLPELQRAGHEIAEFNPTEDLSRTRDRLSNWLRLTRKRKEKFSGRGQANNYADKLAEFVAQLFEHLRLPLTIGTNPYNDEPNTKFSKAVRSAIRIYDVRRSAQKSTQTDQAGETTTKRVRPELVSSFVHWRPPSQKAIDRRKG